MKKIMLFAIILTFFASKNAQSSENTGKENYVLFAEKVYYTETDSFRLDAFEIMAHPVTNAEYKLFTDATGYTCPLHWINGKIPEGKENYPVIYVNRDDVDAYLQWLNINSERSYRLPTSLEYKAAASAEKIDRKYAWGNDDFLPDINNVNFDAKGNRNFQQWERYMKPADWGMKNEKGLYQMAGNVWHLVDNTLDCQGAGSKYRIETLSSNERFIMGGSWASTFDELGLGRTFHQSPAIRYPDLSFRLVRNPKGIKWVKKYRNVAPVTHPSGIISVSWSILKSDPGNIRFNIYRLTGNSRPHSGFKLNKQPLTTSSYLDVSPIEKNVRYQYRVAAVDQNGKETDFSEWIGITAGEYKYPVVVKFKPLTDEGSMVPVFGDLEGWGRRGCVIKLENGNKAMQPDPGKPVQLEAFSSTGKSLWRKDIAWHGNIYGNGTNAAFNVWDMSGDGKAEVITLLQIGEENYVAILDGMSGKVIYKTLWDKMATDFSRASTRVHLSIAYLDGITPSVITQTGIYENEIISAYDNQLNKLWQYNSFNATSGSGSHKIEIADVDGDGKQEVVYGTTCLNSDGKVRWSTYLGHPDIVSVADYIPERPGMEVCFIIETRKAGIYLADANTGEIIWKNNRADDPTWSHGHYGWTSDIWDGSPGIECLTNRKGHGDGNILLFTADGQKVMENFPRTSPFEWDGDKTRELFWQNGQVMGKFNGKEIEIMEEVKPNPVPDSGVRFTADLYGDFRSEMVIETKDTDGRRVIMVIAAPEPINKMFISPSESIDFQLWLGRNMGGGYGSILNFELKNPGSVSTKTK